MSRYRCFWKAFEEPEPGDEEDADWDEASRMVLHQGESGEDPDLPQRALCPECSRPLRRMARVPTLATCLLCMVPRECERCEEDILPGALHFACGGCQVRVCGPCGPGVYIEREFDFKDTLTGEERIEEVPSKVVHSRSKSRSLLVSSASSGQSVAQQVVWHVKQLVARIPDEQEEVYDKDWEEEGVLAAMLGTHPNDIQGIMQRLLALVEEARQLFASQAALVDVTVPCKVYGDIHGQFRDVLLLFDAYGMPGDGPSVPSFVFNGDFVDRGKHQLEVVCALFALKILFPNKVVMNRGNHEDKHMNTKYGFRKVCVEHLGEEAGGIAYDRINDAFDYLPFGALIGEKVLAVHGGIGTGDWNVDDLRYVQRPINHSDLAEAHNQWLWNILWSDPVEDDQARNTFGVHRSPRSKSAVRFGWNVTSAFCARNGLSLVIRSHQSKRGGYGFDVMHNESLMRVFSARDYEGNGNDGAVLHIQQAEGEEDGLLTVRPQVLHSLTKAMS